MRPARQPAAMRARASRGGMVIARHASVVANTLASGRGGNQTEGCSPRSSAPCATQPMLPSQGMTSSNQKANTLR